MRYPEPDEFSDDHQLLLAIVRRYCQRTLHHLGLERLEDYPVHQLPETLTRHLGQDGAQSLRSDIDDLMERIDRDSARPALLHHGLLGGQLRFKAACLAAADRRLFARGRAALSDGRRRTGVIVAMISVGGIVDKIIDSVIEASGAGTSVREIGDIASDVIAREVDK